MVIKTIYTLFLALLIALFVGLGIDSFYKGPTRPEYPMELNLSKPNNSELTIEQQNIEKEFYAQQKEHDALSKVYNRNVSIVTLICSIIILVLSLTFMAKIKMIADGILLGGVFTTAYGIIRGFMSDSSQFRFLVVTMGLLIALILGYVKFIRPSKFVE